MTIETLPATTDAQGTGTFGAEGQMYDGDVNSLGTMTAAAGTDAEIVVKGFFADQNASGRTAATVRVTFRYNALSDQYTKFAVRFRPTGVASWTLLDEDTQGSTSWAVAPAAAVTRTFDITSVAGVNAATGFEVGYQLYAGTVGSPTLPAWNL